MREPAESTTHGKFAHVYLPHCGGVAATFLERCRLSEQAAALFGSFAALDIGEGTKIDIVDAKLKYAALFDHMVCLGLGAAVVALLLSPLIKRWMHGVK